LRTLSNPGFFILSQSGDAAGAIRRVLPLRRDAFQPKLASMAEYDLAVLVLDVLVEPDAGADFDQDRGERGLADLEAARGAAGQRPRCPCPPVRFPGFEGYRRLMGPRGEAAN
jgi:hypothetical protein